MKRFLLLLISVVVLASLPVTGRGDGPEKSIRLGMIGLNTSHVIAFARYLNDPKNGCETVRRIKTDRGDMVVGVWKDGRSVRRHQRPGQ